MCVCEGGPICRPHRVSRFLSEYQDLGSVHSWIHLKTAKTELLEDLVSQMDTFENTVFALKCGL